jgi:hypothetical protein
MPEPLPPQEKLRRLTEFVWHLQEFMEAVVRRPYGILPGRHHDVLRAAWPELIPTFDNLRKAINDPAIPGVLLHELGLAGFRLQFELAIFDHARALLLDHAPELFELPTPAIVQEPRAQARKPGFFRRVGRLLRRCLKAGDVVLGSLSGLFPPTEAITQLKEGIEEGITLVRGEKES